VNPNFKWKPPSRTKHACLYSNFKWKRPSRTKHACCTQISNGNHLQEQNMIVVPKFQMETTFKNNTCLLYPNFKWKPPSRTKHVCCTQISNGTHLQEQNILYPNFKWNQIQEQDKFCTKSALNLNLRKCILTWYFGNCNCMWYDHGGREVTYIVTKIKSVQNEVFVYYFKGKIYECLENKLCPQIIRQIFIIWAIHLKI
jgi:hypothetical protein